MTEPTEAITETAAGICGATAPNLLGAAGFDADWCVLLHGHGGWHRSPLGTEWGRVPTEGPRVADLPCPKCGDTDVVIRHCDPPRKWSSTRTCGGMSDPEHFDRTCQRCLYAWRTDDVLVDRETR